ncbi:MAG: 3-dehydroquinate synthase [Planctomycetes bacterium]|nr:3-dehydroquinate synthase [Planctomycetota bacterium]
MTMHRISIDVPARARPYEVWIGRGILDRVASLLGPATRVGVLTDENVARLWSERLVDLCRAARPEVEFLEIVVPSGETHKNLGTAEAVWRRLEAASCDRHSLLVDLGGGVIGDLGGFVAACYLRGIDFIQVPTTLLAQVDASVGGKVGVDLGSAKNRIGAFAQPRGVVIDIDTLETLPPTIYRCGFAEIIKHLLIADRGAFERFDPRVAVDSAHPTLVEIVRQSVEIKAEVVRDDEREAGRRKVLNAGHTIGHALESASLERAARDEGKALEHGEAISIGLVVEAEIASRCTDGIASADVEAIEAKLAACDLPTRVPSSWIPRVLEWIATDKKRRGSLLEWSLLDEIGRCRYDCRVPIEEVSRALHERSDPE